jgi:Ca2+-dependent lipid-binding protein
MLSQHKPEHSPPQYLPLRACRTLDPDWGEEFYLEWSEVAAGKRLVLVEVWDWDFWRPDELLGRGFIDINALAFEPQEVRMM